MHGAFKNPRNRCSRRSNEAEADYGPRSASLPRRLQRLLKLAPFLSALTLIVFRETARSATGDIKSAGNRTFARQPPPGTPLAAEAKAELQKGLAGLGEE